MSRLRFDFQELLTVTDAAALQWQEELMMLFVRADWRHYLRIIALGSVIAGNISLLLQQLATQMAIPRFMYSAI